MARLIALLAAVAMAAIVEIAVARNYDVGGPSGAWDLSTNYSQWVSGKQFHVDDTLTFTYSSSTHDVAEVTAADYGSCSGSNPISRNATGNTVITLATIGKRYFICAVPTHCTRGMKVEIDVVAASGPPSPTGSLSPSGSPATSPPAPESSSTSPPPPPPAPSAAPESVWKQAGVAAGVGVGAILMVLGL